MTENDIGPAQGQPHVTRHVIGTSDCDPLGHMNVARYFALCNEGGFAMQRAIGWPPGVANAGRRYSFAVVSSRSEFLSEVMAGESLLVHNGISRIGRKSAVFDIVITRENGEKVFHSAWQSALLDLDARRAVAIPEDLRSALQNYLVDASLEPGS